MRKCVGGRGGGVVHAVEREGEDLKEKIRLLCALRGACCFGSEAIRVITAVRCEHR